MKHNTPLFPKVQVKQKGHFRWAQIINYFMQIKPL